MFRKLVSNLPYSPALISEIGFYANRLRDEDITRRVTLLFVVLTLIMQSFSLLSPPESVNASSEQDIIRGGVRDLSDFLARYDHNEDDVKDIYSAVGISRSEIAAAKPGTITPKSDTYVLSRFGQLSSSSKEIGLSYQRSAGGTGVRYFSPLADIAELNQSFTGWVGQSAILGWFGIVKTNGSLATHGIPTTFTPHGDNTMHALKKVTIQNISEDDLSEKISAKPLDKISYTLQLSNPYSTTVSGEFSVRIADALEYATLIDNGGAKLNQKSGTLSWPSIELAPGQMEKRTFVIQMLSSLPATSRGVSNPESYDCKMKIAFGNIGTTNVDCPAAKDFETILNQLPSVGLGGNLLFAGVILSIATFFTLRTRQLKNELKIIRHNFNTGII